MGLLAIYFAGSIIFSFLCSIWEAVLLSITPAYANTKMQEGSQLGKDLNDYKKDIDRPLSAILTLNTIAHTVGAIMVGVQAGKVFGTTSLNFLGISISGETIVAALMTFFILILSEIIPKTIGANKWRSLTPFTIKSIKFILFILAPLVWLSQLITKGFKADPHKSVLSRADFTAMAMAGAEDGTIEKSESRIITNLMKLKELTVHDIMTPRTVITTADESLTCRAFYDANDPIRFSRIPVYKDNQDGISGMVLKDDLLKELAEDRDSTTLGGIKREITIVDDKWHLQKLFDKMIVDKVHIAAVNDSYGSLVGLVTMEDLLETILGLEIMDESDNVEDLQILARAKARERAEAIKLK